MTILSGLRRWLHAQTPTSGTQLVATAAVVLVVVVIGVGILRLSDRSQKRWDPAVVETTAALLLGILGVAGMSAIVGIWRAGDQVASSLAVLDLNPVLVAVTVFLLFGAYGTTRLTRRFFRGFAAGTSTFSDHQRAVVHHVTQVVVYLFTILIVLSLWQVNVGNLLLGAGVLGIVLGLAARQTLGAVLAGFVVLFSRPFEVGDWVKIEDHEGTVREITIVNTRIQTFDGETVMVPNDIVTGTQVVNRSREGRLRVNVDIGIDYESEIPMAIETAEEAMRTVDPVRDSPTPRAVVAEFDDSAVVLRLRFWIDDPDARRYWGARTAVVEAVKDAFDTADIKIPFPQRELSGRAERGGLVVDAETPPVPAEAGDETAPDGDD
jgi:small conductance mechanosensitive channel